MSSDFSRRNFLHVAAGAAAVAGPLGRALGSIAFAQQLPAPPGLPEPVVPIARRATVALVCVCVFFALAVTTTFLTAFYIFRVVFLVFWGDYRGSHHPHAFRRPNSGLYEWLARELPARDVRGIIFRRFAWCDLWHAELQRLKEWTPLPVLEIDAGPDDAAAPNRVEGRIEAFLEMLK